tara:strand:- start:411 stop:815 length:405 start_codon:yes stop_codon:yes gene_type:complete
MELDFTLTTISVFVIIMLIMFARVNVSYQPGKGAKTIPTVKRHLLNSRNDTTKSVNTHIKTNIMKKNDNHPKYSAFGLPPKDSYMTKGLRDQIDSLRTKLYYDNCKYRLLEEFEDKHNASCNHPYINIEYVPST